jgi:hypothetical protein
MQQSHSFTGAAAGTSGCGSSYLLLTSLQSISGRATLNSDLLLPFATANFICLNTKSYKNINFN